MDWRRTVLEIVAVGVALLSVYLMFSYKGQHHKSDDSNVITPIYHFGDSNSDTGSFTSALGRLLPPYGKTSFGEPPSRFSDGRLIIDFILEALELPYLRSPLDSSVPDFGHGANFAAAGSTVQRLDPQRFKAGCSPFTLDIQVTQFEQFIARSLSQPLEKGKDNKSKLSRPAPGSLSSAVFSIDHGQNDLNSLLTVSTPEEVMASIPYITGNLSTAIARLYSLGARNFWIYNTGPHGCLPYFLKKNPQDPSGLDRIGCIESINKVDQEFNKQLNVTLTELWNQLEGARIVPIDIYSIKYSMIGMAKAIGFPDPLGCCCEINILLPDLITCGKMKAVIGGNVTFESCNNPSEYISWDGIHYTEAANRWVVESIFDGSFSETTFSWLKPV